MASEESEHDIGDPATVNGRRNSREPSREPSEDGELDKNSSSTVQPDSIDHPPLPHEAPPPLPSEAPPVEDDGWEALWDESAQAFYFYNRFTQASQWTNPRVPDPSTQPAPPGLGNNDRRSGAPLGAPPSGTLKPSAADPPAEYTGYNPAIHGDYDPTAPYAQPPAAHEIDPPDPSIQPQADPTDPYAATGTFNRFTGKWQHQDITPDLHNDENKSKRQMSAFFDVDAAANSHYGKSLKAERAGKKLSKQELRAFKEKRKERKEEKRRAWLRD